MKKLLKGLKAGGVPGIFIAFLSFLVNYYLLEIKYRQELSEALGRPYHPSFYGLTLNSLATFTILSICGVLYVVLYRKLPIKRPFWKAFIFGFSIFAISRIGDLITDYPLSVGLTLENAIWSSLFLLVVWPYFTSRLYFERF